MNYEKILEQIKVKTERRMALNDPKSKYHEYHAALEDGKYSLKQLEFSFWDWTRSFLTGAVALMYSEYGEEKFKKYLDDSYDRYHDYLKTSKKYHNIHHDAGFITVLSAIANYELTGDKKSYNLALEICDQFAKTFRIECGVFQGFGGAVGDTVTICDDMMNISLMMWAYKQTGHQYYRTLFTTHIETFLSHMLRDDYSLKHTFRFDETGKPLGEENDCGYGPGSTWARGNAWVTYGLVNAITVMHHTEGMDRDDIEKKLSKLSIDNRLIFQSDMKKTKRYLHVLNGIINRYLNSLPENLIPNWDFREFSQEDGEKLDTSAAMIFASAIYKLSTVTDITKFQGIGKHALEYADKILENVTKECLSPADHECFIDHGQTGKFSVGCVWGDYFYLEAIMRKLHGKDAPEFWSTEVVFNQPKY
jgi:unsaturated chondroitin disaccharide hydrolase